MLHKTGEELTRTYGEQKTVLRRSVRKLLKSVATIFVVMSLCTCRTTPEQCVQEIFELDYFSGQLRRNWTGCSEESFESGIDVCGG